jgi:hypothetical protein
MKPANRTVASALVITSIVLACAGDVSRPSDTGQIALALALQGAAQAPLDAMTVELSGPTNTTIDLVLNGGFFEGTAEDLDVGTYTLTAIGEGDGEVTYYGTRSGVNVTADQTTDAAVPIVEFIPVLTSVDPDAPTKVMTFQVEFTGVDVATTYKVEWESGDTGGFVNTTSTSVDVPVTVSGDIEFKVRAGNDDVDPDDAQESEPLFATVEEDNASNDQATAVQFGAGIGTDITLTDFNIVPAAEEDWIYIDVAGGERVSLRVRTESLEIPSALDPVITLYDVDGNVVDMNDDIDASTVESELIHVPAAAGQLYIVVSSAGGGSAGHYELTVQVDNNQPVVAMDVVPNNVVIVTGHTLLLSATPRDASGNRLFRPVTVTVNDPDVATIDADGIITGVAPGRATFTVESAGVVNGIAVEVRAPATAVPVAIDGAMTAGEWDNALRIQTGAGAGTVSNATILVMNDETNMYLALVVPDATPQATAIDFAWFRLDNANNRTLDVNDDLLAVGVLVFVDAYYNGTSYFADPESNGMGLGSYSGGNAFIETSHPLNSGDLNDIAITPGARFGLCVSYFNDNATTGAYPANCEQAPTQQDRYVVIQSNEE